MKTPKIHEFPHRPLSREAKVAWTALREYQRLAPLGSGLTDEEQILAFARHVLRVARDFDAENRDGSDA